MEPVNAAVRAQLGNTRMVLQPPAWPARLENTLLLVPVAAFSARVEATAMIIQDPLSARSVLQGSSPTALVKISANYAVLESSRSRVALSVSPVKRASILQHWAAEYVMTVMPEHTAMKRLMSVECARQESFKRAKAEANVTLAKQGNSTTTTANHLVQIAVLESSVLPGRQNAPSVSLGHTAPEAQLSVLPAMMESTPEYIAQ